MYVITRAHCHRVSHAVLSSLLADDSSCGSSTEISVIRHLSDCVGDNGPNAMTDHT